MKPSVHLLDLLGCVASAMDRISPALADHHKRVAYIAGTLARARGYGAEDLRQIMTVALLHDVGALSLEARLDTLDFDEEDLDDHPTIGASIRGVSPELAMPTEILEKQDRLDDRERDIVQTRTTRRHRLSLPLGSPRTLARGTNPRRCRCLHRLDREATLPPRNDTA